MLEYCPLHTILTELIRGLKYPFLLHCPGKNFSIQSASPIRCHTLNSAERNTKKQNGCTHHKLWLGKYGDKRTWKYSPFVCVSNPEMSPARDSQARLSQSGINSVLDVFWENCPNEKLRSNYQCTNKEKLLVPASKAPWRSRLIEPSRVAVRTVVGCSPIETA